MPNIVKIINKMGYKVIHLNGPNEPDVPNATKVNGSYLDSVKILGYRLSLATLNGMGCLWLYTQLWVFMRGVTTLQAHRRTGNRQTKCRLLEAHSINKISKQDIVATVIRG